MSIKDRIAKFENIINGSVDLPPKTDPVQPANNSKPSPQPIIQQPPSQPPVVSTQSATSSVSKQGEVESPSVVKPSVARQSWQQNSFNVQPVNQPKVKEEVVTKPVAEKRVPLTNPGTLNVSKPAEDEEDKALSPSMIKQMLEGKVMNMNRQSFPVNPRSLIPKVEEEGSKEAPVVTSQGGGVKGNTQKLNLFFENQKSKGEEEGKRKVETK